MSGFEAYSTTAVTDVAWLAFHLNQINFNYLTVKIHHVYTNSCLILSRLLSMMLDSVLQILKKIHIPILGMKKMELKMGFFFFPLNLFLKMFFKTLTSGDTFQD